MKRVAQRIARVVRYGRTLGHLRHYRGYGVHSPFVYRVVREAVMQKREVAGDDLSLYERLRSLGVNRRRAVQLQNFYTISGCSRFVVDDEWSASVGDDVMWIVTTATAPEVIEAIESVVGERKVVVTIVYPRNNSARYKATRRAIRAHHGLSFDNIGFVALLCNDKRQKQHIYI